MAARTQTGDSVLRAIAYPTSESEHYHQWGDPLVSMLPVTYGRDEGSCRKECKTMRMRKAGARIITRIAQPTLVAS